MHRRLVVISIVIAFSIAAISRTAVVNYLINNARQTLQAGRPDAAQDSLWIAEILDRNNALVALIRARAYRRAGNFDGQAMQLSRAKRLGISPDTLQLEVTLSHAQRGRLSDPAQKLRRLLADPFVDSVEVCYAFARGARRSDDAKLLLSLLDHWRDLNPNDQLQFLVRGEMLEDDQNWLPAEQAYRHVLQLDNSNVSARFGLGLSLLQQARPNEAIKCYDWILESDPDHSAAIAGRAKCLSEQGNFESARKLFLQVLEKQPGDFMSRLEVGRLELKRGHFKEAIRWLQPLTLEASYDMDVRYQLALALKADGAESEAAVHFRHLEQLQGDLLRSAKLTDQVRAHPDDLDARFELGVLVLKSFDPSRGLFWLNSVLARDPLHRRTHEALAEHFRTQGNTRLVDHHRKHLKESEKPAGTQERSHVE